MSSQNLKSKILPTKQKGVDSKEDFDASQTQEANPQEKHQRNHLVPYRTKPNHNLAKIRAKVRVITFLSQFQFLSPFQTKPRAERTGRPDQHTRPQILRRVIQTQSHTPKQTMIMPTIDATPTPSKLVKMLEVDTSSDLPPHPKAQTLDLSHTIQIHLVNPFLRRAPH